jgi:hypothetical protein
MLRKRLRDQSRQHVETTDGKISPKTMQHSGMEGEVSREQKRMKTTREKQKRRE